MHANSTYSWRLIIFVVALVTGFLLLILRLADVQIARGATFLQQANSNRFFSVRIPPERGILYDRYNKPLTYNTPRYFHLKTPDAIYSDRVAIETSEALSLKATDSAHVMYELERDYVYGPALAHVLGYTGLVSSNDLLKDSSLFADDRVGKLGLEKQFDSMMRGQSGETIFEINALGQRQRVVQTQPGKPGSPVYTTLDPYVSAVAYEALGNQKGAVVVLDAQNSEVLALVSTPSYEPSLLSQRQIDTQKEKERKQVVQELFDNPANVFFNRALSGSYPPGSVFKLVTGLAGLEAGAFDANTTVQDEGVLKVGEYSYANWFYTQYGGKDGTVSLQRAIARSNDIYFYKAAEWLGPQKLADGARLFGLGSKTGIDIGGEASGLVPDPKWKEETIGEKWFLGNTYHFGIGQSDLLVTPLQVAQYTQALADMGRLCQPHLVKQSQNNQQNLCKEVGVHENNLQIIIKGMLDACSDGGTAFPFFPHNRTYRPAEEPNAYKELQAGAVACKTGTAEFGGVDEKGYRKTHGWFTSIIDTENLLAVSASASAAVAASDSATIATPSATLKKEYDEKKLYEEWKADTQKNGFPKKLVIVAVVESDEEKPYKEGSKDAGPIVKKLLDWMQGKEAVVPAPIAGQGE